MFRNAIKETTLGGGNCAFNAFILGFFRREVLDHLEAQLQKENIEPNQAFAEFIAQAKGVLKLDENADWNTVKSAILTLEKHDKQRLQQDFADCMRQLAMQGADSPQEKDKLADLMLGAFDNYLKHKNLENENKDDIFIVHSFIKEKFKSCQEKYKNDVQAAKNELAQWWKDKGHDEFIQAMKTNGTWAGDLELARLAAYFHVNLHEVNNDHFLHFACGEIPADEINKLTEDEINLLHYIGMINTPANIRDGNKALLMMTKQDVLKKIQNIPQRENVIDYIMGQTINKKISPDTPVPEEWTEECKLALLHRGIIRKDENDNTNKKYKFNEFKLTEDHQIWDRLTDIDNEKILNLWEKYYKNSPTLRLINDNGIHWSNTNKKSYFQFTAPSQPIDESMLDEEMKKLHKKDQIADFKRGMSNKHKVKIHTALHMIKEDEDKKRVNIGGDRSSQKPLIAKAGSPESLSRHVSWGDNKKKNGKDVQHPTAISEKIETDLATIKLKCLMNEMLYNTTPVDIVFDDKNKKIIITANGIEYDFFDLRNKADLNQIEFNATDLEKFKEKLLGQFYNTDSSPQSPNKLDENTGEVVRTPQKYTFFLMPEDMSDKPLDLKSDCLYFKKEGNTLVYQAVVKNEIVTGNISENVIRKKTGNNAFSLSDPLSLTQLNAISDSILDITAKRGHTASSVAKVEDFYCHFFITEVLPTKDSTKNLPSSTYIEYNNNGKFKLYYLDRNRKIKKVTDLNKSLAKEYNLELISSLAEDDKNKAEKNKIYLSMDGKYVLRDLNGQVQEGNFDITLIKNNNLAGMLKDKQFVMNILEITSKAGYTVGKKMPQPKKYEDEKDLANQLNNPEILKYVIKDKAQYFDEHFGKEKEILNRKFPKKNWNKISVSHLLAIQQTSIEGFNRPTNALFRGNYNGVTNFLNERENPQFKPDKRTKLKREAIERYILSFLIANNGVLKYSAQQNTKRIEERTEAFEKVLNDKLSADGFHEKSMLSTANADSGFIEPKLEIAHTATTPYAMVFYPNFKSMDISPISVLPGESEYASPQCVIDYTEKKSIGGIRNLVGKQREMSKPKEIHELIQTSIDNLMAQIRNIENETEKKEMLNKLVELDKEYKNLHPKENKNRQPLKLSATPPSFYEKATSWLSRQFTSAYDSISSGLASVYEAINPSAKEERIERETRNLLSLGSWSDKISKLNDEIKVKKFKTKLEATEKLAEKGKPIEMEKQGGGARSNVKAKVKIKENSSAAQERIDRVNGYVQTTKEIKDSPIMNTAINAKARTVNDSAYNLDAKPVYEGNVYEEAVAVKNKLLKIEAPLNAELLTRKEFKLNSADKDKHITTIPANVTTAKHIPVNSVAICTYDKSQDRAKSEIFMTDEDILKIKNEKRIKSGDKSGDSFYHKIVPGVLRDEVSIPGEAALKLAYQFVIPLLPTLKPGKPIFIENKKFPPELIEAIVLYLKFKKIPLPPGYEEKHFPHLKQQLVLFEKTWEKLHPEDMGMAKEATPTATIGQAKSQGQSQTK